MMVEIDIRGLDAVQRQLLGLAVEQLPYAMSLALNRTAFTLQKDSRKRLEQTFEKPTPQIKGATRVEKATKQNLTARVLIDPRRAVVLRTHEFGGRRGQQRLERVIVGRGWMPGEYRAVPCALMPLDTYGNPQRKAVNEIMLSILKFGASGQRGDARRVFVISVGSRSHLHPGIYRTLSRATGRAIAPLYLFVPRAQYKAILNWEQTMVADALRVLPGYAAEAVDQALRTAR
ncbi:MAG: hypothetical protein NHG36_20000 [Chromatiaceae bacterium]|nr:hypothetical protein [Candidatus Thioaporhodococcus sediminis]